MKGANLSRALREPPIAALILVLVVSASFSNAAIAQSSAAILAAETRGDAAMTQERFVDAVGAYAKALTHLGMDPTRFQQQTPGTLPQLGDPLRAAIVIRKWARAVQFAGDQTYLRTGAIPFEALLQAVFASSSAANILEGLREWSPLDQQSLALTVARELRLTYDIQVEILYLASREPRFVTRALEASSRARGRSLFDAVWTRQTLAIQQADPAAQRTLSTEIRIEEFSRSLLEEQAEAAPRADVVSDLGQRLRKARGERQSSPVLARQPSVAAGGLASRSRLEIGQAVIQYHVTDRMVFVFYIPEVGPVQIKLLRPTAQELHSLVQSYARKLRDPRLPWKQTSTELYVELLSPLDHLIEGLDHLIIVPSGFLYQVPFGTLWDTRSGKLLRDRVAYSLLPHIQLIGLARQSPSPPSALVLGIRNFASQPELSLGEIEARDVRDALGKTLGGSVTLLLGSRGEATKEQLLSRLPEHGIVHLGTHGVPDRRPMLSRLIIKHTAGGDAAISALDLLEVERPLRASLVTLSACDTGTVQPGSADDILGLPRAFLLAGARSVIGTLWPVPQDATANLMRQLYLALTRPGTSVSVALAKAQQITAGATGGKWEHPYYWGASIVIGDGTASPFQNKPEAQGRLE